MGAKFRRFILSSKRRDGYPAITMMKLAIVVVASSCLAAHEASAFITTPRPSSIATKNLQALPGVDQVATDGFMKQLGHASQLIPLLHPQDGKELSVDETNDLRNVLFRQLR